MKKPLKPIVKSILLMTLFYIILSSVLIVLIDQNVTQLDTDRVLGRAQRAADRIKINPMLTFSSDIEQVSNEVSNASIENIQKGAVYSREMTSQEIKVTIPVLKQGKVMSYLIVTDSRSSTLFINSAIILFSLILWGFSIYGLSRRTYKRAQFTSETVAKIKNIERSPLTQSYLITKDDDPITIALNGLGEDIQARILSNQEAKENLYEFIEFFQFPIFVFDGKGAFHRSNAAFQNEFARANSIDAFSLYPEFLNFLVEKMVHPDIQNKTFYFERINSYYQVLFNPLEMLNNRYMVAMYDVSNYYQMMQSRTEFTNNMSLALKSPLEQIQQAAEQISEVGLKKEILKEIKWLATLLNDSLSLTSGGFQNKRSEVRVAELINTLLEEYQAEMLQKQLSLKLELAPLSFRTDVPRLRVILSKLIANAVHSSKEGGEIELVLTKGAKKLEFRITDSGAGLTELQQSRLFEKFYQADTDFSNRMSNGLGLALVKKNVEELKGRLKLSSEVGQGSTFTVIF